MRRIIRMGEVRLRGRKSALRMFERGVPVSTIIERCRHKALWAQTPLASCILYAIADWAHDNL